MLELKSFDVGRAMLDDYLDSATFPGRIDIDIAQAKPLKDALEAGDVALDTRMLTFEHEGKLYTFPMTLVLSHNVIQGDTPTGEPWVMTFCNACNTGMVFNSTMEGRNFNFHRRGAYEGLLLLWDEETHSYWQHITGQCLYGKSEGKKLQEIATTRQMSTAEALIYPMPAVLIDSALTPGQKKLSGAMETMRAHPERVEDRIFSTVEAEDKRRPRFELGLGVWKDEVSRFFPLILLHSTDNAYVTEFEGRQMLIYQTPDAIAPVAAYLTTRYARWRGDVLRLDNGAYIQEETYFAPDGYSQPLERPRQLLMRWYGFALTFPNCTLPQMG